MSVLLAEDMTNLMFAHGYYSRKYLNNLPRIAEWVRANTTCYVEQIEGDEHVIVWPSRQKYDEYTERARVNATPIKPSGSERTVLQRQLQAAIENNDFVAVSRIKQQMKENKQ